MTGDERKGLLKFTNMGKRQGYKQQEIKLAVELLFQKKILKKKVETKIIKGRQKVVLGIEHSPWTRKPKDDRNATI